MTLTKPQTKSLYRKWLQNDQGLTYLSFRRSVIVNTLSDCAIVKWCGLYLGIELDGYTHS